MVNATGWLTDEQIASITPDEKLQKALRGGCYTAIISPEGVPLCEPITSGEGMAIAELDPGLITKRKRMMDSAGHYSRPDLFTLHIDREERVQVRSKNAPTIAPATAGSGALNEPESNYDHDDHGLPNRIAHAEAAPAL